MGCSCLFPPRQDKYKQNQKASDPKFDSTKHNLNSSLGVQIGSVTIIPQTFQRQQPSLKVSDNAISQNNLLPDLLPSLIQKADSLGLPQKQQKEKISLDPGQQRKIKNPSRIFSQENFVIEEVSKESIDNQPLKFSNSIKLEIQKQELKQSTFPSMNIGNYPSLPIKSEYQYKDITPSSIILNKASSHLPPLPPLPPLKQPLIKLMQNEIWIRITWKKEVQLLFKQDMFSLEALKWFRTIDQHIDRLEDWIADLEKGGRKGRVEEEVRRMGEEDREGFEFIKKSFQLK